MTSDDVIITQEIKRQLIFTRIIFDVLDMIFSGSKALLGDIEFESNRELLEEEILYVLDMITNTVGNLLIIILKSDNYSKMNINAFYDLIDEFANGIKKHISIAMEK